MSVPVTGTQARFPEEWAASPLVQLTRYTVGWIKGLFAQLPRGTYWWNPDAESEPDQGDSEIFISSDTPMNPSFIGQRPAITVTRSSAAFQGMGIGDRAFLDMRTGALAKMDIMPTTLIINVLSRVPFEAENLAWLVGSSIWAMRETFIKNQSGLLYIGGKFSIAPVSPAGSLVSPDNEHNWAAVAVAFPAYLQHSMSTMPLATPVVQKIKTTAVAVGPTPHVQAAVPLQGTAVGQPMIGTGLPQTGAIEAESTEPLTVIVETQ